MKSSANFERGHERLYFLETARTDFRSGIVCMCTAFRGFLSSGETGMETMIPPPLILCPTEAHQEDVAAAKFLMRQVRSECWPGVMIWSRSR